MIRIAGIDRELSTLEVVWHQSSDDEKAMLATGFLKGLYDRAGQAIELKVDTEDGMYTITVEKSNE